MDVWAGGRADLEMVGERNFPCLFSPTCNWFLLSAITSGTVFLSRNNWVNILITFFLFLIRIYIFIFFYSWREDPIVKGKTVNRLLENEKYNNALDFFLIRCQGKRWIDNILYYKCVKRTKFKVKAGIDRKIVENRHGNNHR